MLYDIRKPLFWEKIDTFPPDHVLQLFSTADRVRVAGAASGALDFPD